MEIKLKKRRYHIIIDATNCNAVILNNKENLDGAIRKIASLCEMNILHGPVIIEGEPINPGLTGFAIIDFSHISIHTFTKNQELCVDVFSCKAFDYEAVKKYIVDTFNLNENYVNYIEVEYPKKNHQVPNHLTTPLSQV